MEKRVKKRKPETKKKPTILICVEGGNVQSVYASNKGVGDVEIMDFDILDDGDAEDLKRYLSERLDLFTPKGRETAEYYIASPEAFDKSQKSLRDIEIDFKKFPVAIY